MAPSGFGKSDACGAFSMSVAKRSAPAATAAHVASEATSPAG